jgi:hypothetical protein
MRYVRPDGTAARVVESAEAGIWLDDGQWYASAALAGPFGDELPEGSRLDWSDGATLGAVEHDVLGPAGWCIDRKGSLWGARRGVAGWRPWRHSLAEALRDALEVIDG